jgi:riboflavin kinase/FMN adenylyltransferase
MELIRGVYNIRPEHRQCAVTIGNFDGLHLGHKKLLQKLIQQAKAQRIRSLVITFEPQPNEFFAAEIPARLMRFREKIIGLQAQGIDYVLCIKFDAHFAKLSAEDFIKEILVEKLHPKYLLVGDDFRFGYQRLGDFNLLKKYALQHFVVEEMSTFNLLNERVSSSRIRKILNMGDMNKAEELLGQPFSMRGRVIHGDKRGRIIGFPTANILLRRKVVPISGVFAVRVLGIQSQPILGVANVGTRPTVGGTRSLLEVHLFNFKDNIYGKEVEVEFMHKLREEKCFGNIDDLKQQIFLDAHNAKKFFQQLPLKQK